MAKKLAILVHKKDDSVIYTSSKTDLATILGVSLRTIIRNYSKIGKYESIDYTIYIGAEKYDSNKEKNYRHDVVPPIVNAVYKEQSHTIANKVDTMSHNDQVIEHIIDINDWKSVEDNMISNQYETYYTNRTVEQLSDSYARYRYSDKQRAAIIERIGAIKQLDR